ncbi:hypothetical protein BC828DRAFT_383468 [Blastocladiella britannica]|nr:hypothetical protein BC828DRAFT_383468 [Blastocladiella britannica]
MFTAAEFDTTLIDFESPVLNGWEKVTTTDGVTVYRKLRDPAGALYEYKAMGNVVDMNYKTAFNVYMDLDYRRQWDNLKPEALRVRPTQSGSTQLLAASGTLSRTSGAVSDSAHPESIYWRVKFPLMMSDRDYVFSREAREMHNAHGQSVYVCMLRSDPEEVASEPEVSGVIRVTDYMQTVVFCPGADPETSTQVYIQYFDDPKGSIPSAVVNWAVSYGIPQFIANIKAACKKYNAKESIPSGKTSEGMQELRETLDASLNDAFHL